MKCVHTNLEARGVEDVDVEAAAALRHVGAHMPLQKEVIRSVSNQVRNQPTDPSLAV
jgi:hypothetical protein